MKDKNTSSLKWNHESLDRICQLAGDFEFLLITTDSLPISRTLWALVHSSLIPSAANAHIHLSFAELGEAASPALRDRIVRDKVDGIVFRAPAMDSSLFLSLCSEVASLPCAGIVLSMNAPSEWEQSFDRLIMLDQTRAEIRWRGGQTSGPLPFSLANSMGTTRLVESRPESRAETKADSGVATSRIPKLASTSPKQIGILSLDPRIQELLQKALETSGCQLTPLDGVIDEESLAKLPSLDLILLSQSWTEGETDLLVRRLARHCPMLVLGTSKMRAEDRVAYYRAGATVVFPKEADIAEIHAAVLRILNITEPSRDVFKKMEQDFSRATQRTKRDMTWKPEECDKAVSYYRPLVENQLKRSFLLGSQSGALVLRLPKFPDAMGNSKWTGLFRRTMTGTLINTLRQNDVSFLVGERLVIFSHQMNPVSCRAIVKRMKGLMDDMNFGNPELASLPATMENIGDAPQEAERLIRWVFDEREIGDRITEISGG